MRRALLVALIATSAALGATALTAAAARTTQNTSQHDVHTARTAAASPALKKLCLVYDHDDSSGMVCLDDSARFLPSRSQVTVSKGPSDWALATVVVATRSGGSEPRLVCLRHSGRYYSKGYAGNSGLGCVPQRGDTPSSFTINGIDVDHNAWWLNEVSARYQPPIDCLTWESYAAGVWCESAPFPKGTPSVQGTQINQDWWYNRVLLPGQRPLVCLTWDGGSDSGNMTCFRQEHPLRGPASLIGVKPQARWGVNDVRLPGQERRLCLAYDHDGNGGLACFADERSFDPLSLRARKWGLGDGWSIWRVSLQARG